MMHSQFYIRSCIGLSLFTQSKEAETSDEAFDVYKLQQIMESNESSESSKELGQIYIMSLLYHYHQLFIEIERENTSFILQACFIYRVST